jgi:uncharacterized protein (TIGR02466 family)
MEKRNLKLFPTPVNYFKEVLLPDQIATIFKYCLDSQVGEHGAFFGKAQSSFSTSSRLIEELEMRFPQLSGLKQGLSNAIREFGQELGFNDLQITNSWFNVQGPGSILKHHVHPESKVSAAFCIHADDKSSKLYFENPNTFLNLVRPDTYREYF